MKPSTINTAPVSPRQLLDAAHTAIAIFDILGDLMWKLHADALLSIREDDHNRVLEMLAMAMVEEAWPLDEEDHDSDDEMTNNDMVSTEL